MRSADHSTRLDNDLRALRAAAESLHIARKVLIYTGAGMSADSGIPTYRDAGGRWRDFTPFTSKGLVPEALARPAMLREDPGHAWAFSEYMRRECRSAIPHAGYGVITRWVTGGLANAFVLTSNIDGMHVRAGVPAVRIYEQYGSLWELQCLSPATPRCATSYWSDERVPVCELDEATMTASGFPDCPYCGGLARPRIEMAEDTQFVKREHDFQRLERFRAGDEPDVVVVIGTFQWLSWPADVRVRPRVININPDPANHAHYADPIAITMRAADALVGLDWMLRRLAAEPGA